MLATPGFAAWLPFKPCETLLIPSLTNK